MATTKKRMRVGKFCAFMVPLAAIMLAIPIAGTCVSNYYSSALDTFVGRGKKVITNSEGTSSWNLDYYKKDNDDSVKSREASCKIAKKVADEGTVLLKNKNGALPLKQDSNVAPFGYRYYNPFYGGTGAGHMAIGDYAVTPEEGLASNFKVAATFDNVTSTTSVKKYYYDLNDGSDVLYYFDATDSWNGSDQSIYEFNKNVYDTDKIQTGSTGIVFLGRAGGENNDLWAIPYNKCGDIEADNAGTADGKISAVKNAQSTDKVRHALDLMPEEEETLALAKEKCDKVVVVINSSNTMELGDLADDDGIDAIVWIGGPGSRGFQSLSDVLCGKVNPSGRTVDTYVRDLTADPTYMNLGDVDGQIYTNTEGMAPMSGKQYSASRKESNPFEYQEYEEGVYLGYKYYETAYDTNLSGFTYGELNADGSTKTPGQVVYPFGYGLSYTTFTQKITSFSGNKDTVSIEVEVSNTGTVDGKDVVQVYLTSPYTETDAQYDIEKPTAVLADFGKVEVAAGKSEKIKIEFTTDELASYSYKHENSDGTKGCYMLDAGDYTVSIRNNSHDVLDSKTFNIGSTIWFDSSNPRNSEKDAQSQWDKDGNPTNIPGARAYDAEAKFKAATNNFEDCNKYMTDTSIVQNLTRKTANGLAVSNLKKAEKQKEAPSWVVNKLQPFAFATDTELGNVEGSKVYHATDPVSKQDNGVSITSYRGVDYYDSSWEDLLNQIDYDSEQLLTLMYKDQYCISPLDAIGLGEQKHLDGPSGLTLTSKFGSSDLSTCAWSTEVVLAATFNKDLAEEMGTSIGQEALTIGCTGWYAPGLNIHRTAFSGRNYEYFSEDAVLAGRLCAREISGASGQGLTCYLKHFAMNDNDSNRANICVWANEQTMRENYLRSFELAIKNAKMTIDYISDSEGNHSQRVMRAATGVMTSYNYIGTKFSSGSYGLNTATLRDEWGFQGAVISDMTGGAPWRRDQTLRAGNDMILYFAQINALDNTSSTAKWAMRNAVHHIAYSAVNSNWMQGAAPGAVITYTTSPWRYYVGIFCGVCYAAAAAILACTIIKGVNQKRHPELY